MAPSLQWGLSGSGSDIAVIHPNNYKYSKHVKCKNLWLFVSRFSSCALASIGGSQSVDVGRHLSFVVWYNCGTGPEMLTENGTKTRTRNITGWRPGRRTGTIIGPGPGPGRMTRTIFGPGPGPGPRPRTYNIRDLVLDQERDQ